MKPKSYRRIGCPRIPHEPAVRNMRCENWESSPCERVIRIDATASIRVRVRPFWVVMQKTETTVLHNPGTLPVLTFPGFYRLFGEGLHDRRVA